MSVVRIVGGLWRGRRLQVPDVPGLRPTADRTREAVFNMAFSLGLPAGATVVDAYCGTGALGIEALSRQAAHVTFIENSADLCRHLHQTLTSLEADTESYSIVCDDAVTALQNLSRNEPATDLLLADPPYETDPWPELLRISPAPRVLIAEAARCIEPTPVWERLRCRRYGQGHITVLRYLHPQPQSDLREAGETHHKKGEP